MIPVTWGWKVSFINVAICCKWVSSRISWVDVSLKIHPLDTSGSVPATILLEVDVSFRVPRKSFEQETVGLVLMHRPRNPAKVNAASEEPDKC